MDILWIRERLYAIRFTHVAMGIGLLYVIVGGMEIVYAFYVYFGACWVFKGLCYWESQLPILLIFLFLFSTKILVNVWMIMGIQKKSHERILPWLIYEAFDVLLAVSLHFVTGRDLLEISSIDIGIIAYSSLKLFVWFIVYTVYKRFKPSSGGNAVGSTADNTQNMESS